MLDSESGERKEQTMRRPLPDEDWRKTNLVAYLQPFFLEGNQ
jgi:hypothetical protein